jgi:shikimate dehydrogenase
MLKHFGSISKSPGKIGEYYYSNYFKYYRIDANYKPFKADDIQEVEKILGNTSFSGFNISMPFKKQVIEFLDVSSQDVHFYNSCNTIKIRNGEFFGFNTDIKGISKFVSNVLATDYVIILGNGAMGKTFRKVLQAQGINNRIVSPSLKNWESRHENCDVLINCTPFGTSLDASPLRLINVNKAIFDLAINGNKLYEMCNSIKYVSGLEFYKEVFLEQFLIHTDISPNPEYFDYLTHRHTKFKLN